MAKKKFEVRDPKTGRTMIIESDQQPTADEIRQHFDATPHVRGEAGTSVEDTDTSSIPRLPGADALRAQRQRDAEQMDRRDRARSGVVPPSAPPVVRKRGPEDYTQADIDMLPAQQAQEAQQIQTSRQTYPSRISRGEIALTPGGVIGAASHAAARGMGSLIDQPASATLADRQRGVLKTLGPAALEGAFTPFLEQASLSTELRDRGIDPGIGPGIAMDVIGDPLSFVPGIGMADDVADLGRLARSGKRLVKKSAKRPAVAGRALANVGSHVGGAAAGATMDEDSPGRGALFGLIGGHALYRTMRLNRAAKVAGLRDLTPDARPGSRLPRAESALEQPADIVGQQPMQVGPPPRTLANVGDYDLNEPIAVNGAHGQAALRMLNEDPNLLEKSTAMRQQGMDAKRALDDQKKGRGGAAVDEGPLFADETSEAPDRITAPRFKGWQEVLEGEPPVALYDWPIDDTGRFTTGAGSELAKAGHAVPEPTEPPPGAGTWTDTGDLMPDQLETLRRYQQQPQSPPAPLTPPQPRLQRPQMGGPRISAQPAAVMVGAAAGSEADHENPGRGALVGALAGFGAAKLAQNPAEAGRLLQDTSGEVGLPARTGLDRMRPKAETALLSQVTKPTSALRIKSLLNASGVSKAERELLKIDEWLDAKGSAVVTPEELKAAIEKGRARLQTTETRGPRAKWANYRNEKLVLEGKRTDDLEFTLQTPEVKGEVPDLEFKRGDEYYEGDESTHINRGGTASLQGPNKTTGLSATTPDGEEFTASTQDFSESMAPEKVLARAEAKRTKYFNTLDRAMAEAEMHSDPAVAEAFGKVYDAVRKNVTHGSMRGNNGIDLDLAQRALIHRAVPQAAIQAGVKSATLRALNEQAEAWISAAQNYGATHAPAMNRAKATMTKALDALDARAANALVDEPELASIVAKLRAKVDAGEKIDFVDDFLGPIRDADPPIRPQGEEFDAFSRAEQDYNMAVIRSRERELVRLTSPHFNESYHRTAADAEAEFQKRVKGVLESRAEKSVRGENFSSNHWPDKNIYTHGRANVRDILGEQTLHIEEAQSDLHQAAREKEVDLETLEPTGKPAAGYRTPERKAEVKRLGEEVLAATQEVTKGAEVLRDRLMEAIPETAQLWASSMRTGDSVAELRPVGLPIRHNDRFLREAGQAIDRADREGKLTSEVASKLRAEEIALSQKNVRVRELQHELTKAERALADALPDAPFKEMSDYVGAVMMRGIAEALDRDLNAISWTTGRQQQNRYKKIWEGITGFEREGDDIIIQSDRPHLRGRRLNNASDNDSLTEIRKALKRKSQALFEEFEDWRKADMRDPSNGPHHTRIVQGDPVIRYEMVDINGDHLGIYDDKAKAAAELKKYYGDGKLEPRAILKWQIVNKDGDFIESVIGTRHEADAALDRINGNHAAPGNPKRTFKVEKLSKPGDPKQWVLYDPVTNEPFQNGRAYDDFEEALEDADMEGERITINEVQEAGEFGYRVMNSEFDDASIDDIFPDQASAYRAADRLNAEWAKEGAETEFSLGQSLNAASRGFEVAYDEVAVSRMKKLGKKYGVAPEQVPMEHYTVTKPAKLSEDERAALESRQGDLASEVDAAHVAASDAYDDYRRIERDPDANQNEKTALFFKLQRAQDAFDKLSLERQALNKRLADSHARVLVDGEYEGKEFKTLEEAEAFAKTQNSSPDNQVWRMKLTPEMKADFERDGLPLLSDAFGAGAAMQFAARNPELAGAVAGGTLGANADEDNRLRGALVGAAAGFSFARVMEKPAEFARFLNDASGEVVISRRIMKGLTPPEFAKLKSNTARALTEQFAKMPSIKEGMNVALEGKAKKGWYEKSGKAIRAIFGVDAPRFMFLLAALSPQVPVSTNLQNAARVWKNWIAAGRPEDYKSIRNIMTKSVRGSKGEKSVLDSWIDNTVTALTTKDQNAIMLSGPKVQSFGMNLMGDHNEVTNDAWESLYAGFIDPGSLSGGRNKAGTDPGKGPGYLALNAWHRLVADELSELTKETWTPANVQETIWSWTKTLDEQAKKAGVTPLEFLKAGRLTPELIAEAPDFALLFHSDPMVAAALKDNYADELKALRGGAGNTGGPGVDHGFAAHSPERAGPEESPGRALLEHAARRIARTRTKRSAFLKAKEERAAAKRLAKEEAEVAAKEARRKANEPVPDWVTEDDAPGGLAGREAGMDEEEIGFAGDADAGTADDADTLGLADQGGGQYTRPKLSSALKPTADGKPARVKFAEELIGMSKPTKIVVTDAETGEDAKAIFKRHREDEFKAEEKQSLLYQDDGPGHARDVAVYRVAEALGFEGLVPETQVADVAGFEDALAGGKLAKFGMTDDKIVKGSAQQWVDGTGEAGQIGKEERREGINAETIGTKEEWYRLYVLDFLVGAKDRHGKNLLVDKAPGPDGVRHLHAIDNTLSFPRISPELNRPGVTGLRIYSPGAYTMAASETERKRIVRALSETDWKTVLDGIGPEARKAFMDRLEFVKRHVMADTFQNPIKYSAAQVKD